MDIQVVIPCFNEALRFQSSELAILVDGGVSLILVDDGSTDETLRSIREFEQSHPGKVETIKLPRNVGKAEAIRQGFERAFEQNAQMVGYLDADFSAPASEMLRLVAELKSRSDVDTVLGSRWLHLGVDIKRSSLRHYLSRVFATFASNLLGIPVYDTQCGAKVFRVTESLKKTMAIPFASRWAFDVELLGRLLQCGESTDSMVEVPLNQWTEMSGSKMTLIGMLRSSFELITIHRSLQAFARQ